MIILGLDPGSRRTGYGVIRKRGNQLELLAAGVITTSSKESMAQRLTNLSAAIEEIAGEWSPDSVALESLFHGVNARSLIVLAQARGALLASLGRQSLCPVELAPAEIKRAITGNGRADKQQVAKMVGLLLGAATRRLGADETDALAAAICLSQLEKRLRLERETSPIRSAS